MKTLILISLGIALKKMLDRKITEKYGKRITELESQIIELQEGFVRVHIRPRKAA